ncbi:head-tail connector protein [Bradyrhizobium sp. Pa8]|uniref:head-tail connector protein n=1 Tax=Bradyrhizobium sp. Pa8 TaxID=3386552 RepID=UPI00403F3386
MSALTLADAKAHLRVSFDSEDTYIQPLIDAAESYIESIGVTISTPPQPAVLHAVRLLVSHWYSNRDAATTEPPKAIALGVDTLLAPFREINI